FSIISQSLGLEMGGSIGIPLYISQALAVAMYIFGFRAGWTYIFPDHPAIVVDFAAFAILFGIGYVSAGLAFKVQYVILAIIIGSLVSVGWAAFGGSMSEPIQWWGDFPGSPETGFAGIGFWAVFAVFFPASTGIMAGANMSGELANPRKSIPIGTLSAIGLSLVVYLALAFWLASSATVDELTGNYTVMVDKAAWGPAVLGGLLGATFSSALSSIVGAPRIMQALAEHNILPGSSWFARKSETGEPRNAMIATGVLVLGALMLRNLNAIAPLITMFFLVTYAMINIVVLLEQSLKLVSFRPLLRIPRAVSLVGAFGCVFAMFIVNPTFSLVAVGVVLVLHAYLMRKHLKAPFGDVRSGLLAAMAEWAAKKMEAMTGPRQKSWKANMLVPVENSAQAAKVYGLLRNLAYPKGFVRLLGLTGQRNYQELTENLPRLADRLQADSVFATWTVVRAASFSENVAAGLEALGGAFFRSNTIFLRLSGNTQRDAEIEHLVDDAKAYELGALIYLGPPPPEGERPADDDEETEEALQAFGRHEGGVHLVLDTPENGWRIGTDLADADLAMLLAYKLKTNWKTRLTITARIQDPGERKDALDYMRAAVELARIPNAMLRLAESEEELDYSVAAGEELPAVTLFSLHAPDDYASMRARSKRVRTPCLFAMDSERENALV
ncbi:MAG: amino acid permease, partial [Oceanidesulfovibrio sp.]